MSYTGTGPDHAHEALIQANERYAIQPDGQHTISADIYLAFWSQVKAQT